MQDRIQVNDFHLSAVNILDCWSVNTRLNPRYKPHAQPVILNLTLLLDHAIKSSDLLRLERIIDYSNSIDYSHIDKLITSLVTSLPPSSTIPSLAAQLATTLLKTYSPIKSLHITLEAPRLLICADSTWVDLHKTRLGVETSTFSFKLPLLIIIGCSAKERHQPQRLIITIILDVKCLVGSRLHYREICDSVITYTQASRFKTVEALCLSIARLCIVDCVQDTVSVKIEKLNCMNFARAFSYQVSRSISDFPGERVVLDERDFALVIVTGPSEDIKAAVSELGLDVFESSFLYHDGLNNVMILKVLLYGF
jgi:dihydroneopterin aldolase